jgi:hypothetical protein
VQSKPTVQLHLDEAASCRYTRLGADDSSAHHGYTLYHRLPSIQTINPSARLPCGYFYKFNQGDQAYDWGKTKCGEKAQHT